MSNLRIEDGLVSERLKLDGQRTSGGQDKTHKSASSHLKSSQGTQIGIGLAKKGQPASHFSFFVFKINSPSFHIHFSLGSFVLFSFPKTISDNAEQSQPSRVVRIPSVVVKPQPSRVEQSQSFLEVSQSRRNEIKQIESIAEDNRYIAFYKSGPSGFLSNFANTPFVWKNKQFQCSEAAFQWTKITRAINEQFANDPKQKKTLLEEAKKFKYANGEDAYDLSKKFRELGVGTPQGWDKFGRVYTMRNILREKFEQNPHLKNLLLATGDTYLLEHRPQHSQDNYWSDGHYGKGKNMLGKLLMQLRREIKNDKVPGTLDIEKLESSYKNKTTNCAKAANKRHLNIAEDKPYSMPS